MYRGRVFGDFGGIDEEVWVQLWSGTLGAVVSAAVAAWVAVAVLKRSNRKQQELVELQLQKQGLQAEQARRNAVLADLLTAANGFMTAAKVSPEAVEEQRLIFETHTYRWELEGRASDNRMEFFKWSAVLYGPAFALSSIPSAPKAIERKWTDFLKKVESNFTGGCLGMGFASGAKLSVMLKVMAEDRGKLKREWEAIMASTEAEVAKMRDEASGSQ